jgi:nitric oxide reductase NorE protein
VDDARFPSHVQDATPRLPGDLGVWLIILLELLTLPSSLCHLRLPHAGGGTVQRLAGTLNLNARALNTVLLISGSWCVARAVSAVRRNASTVGARWLRGALACGGGLGVCCEHAQKWRLGVDLSTNTFYMFYLFLTGFHFLHVVVGMLALGYLWVKTRRGCYGSHDCHALETGAAFWHMVDLLWIVLFPLVYVMR